MELTHYLTDHYRPATAAAYGREITLYRTAHPEAGNYGYGQVLDYIGQCRNKYSNPQTINRILASVKVYYAWLCDTGQRKDNPAKSIRLRDSRTKDLQLQDLFRPEELEELSERKEQVWGPGDP